MVRGVDLNSPGSGRDAEMSEFYGFGAKFY